ncbi:hypothetical protein, partial [Pseudomonas viridiflava]|uniref:hypothetical protein n=1 Tax=Pseudomonas viridiflava TaxID=33069 RepID=UPI00197DF93B
GKCDRHAGFRVQAGGAGLALIALAPGCDAERHGLHATRSMGTIINLTLTVPTLQRGNASLDALRPLLM